MVTFETGIDDMYLRITCKWSDNQGYYPVDIMVKNPEGKFEQAPIAVYEWIECDKELLDWIRWEALENE